MSEISYNRRQNKLNHAKVVSIILATRNRANLLKKCVNSILAQSYHNWELIICDDASTDDTLLVAKEFAARDPRISYHRNPACIGSHASINKAVPTSQGDFVFVLEDDLTFESDCLKILVKTFQEIASNNSKVGAIAPRWIIERKKTGQFFKDIFYYLGDIKRKKMTTPCELDMKTGDVYANYGIDLNEVQEVPSIHADSLFSKRVFEEVGGYDTKLFKGSQCCEDSLTFKIKSKGYKLYFQSKAVAYHERVAVGGRHEGSKLAWVYFYLRNNIIFKVKFFRWRALYMIPLFLLFIVVGIFRYFPLWLRERRKTVK